MTHGGLLVRHLLLLLLIVLLLEPSVHEDPLHTTDQLRRKQSCCESLARLRAASIKFRAKINLFSTVWRTAESPAVTPSLMGWYSPAEHCSSQSAPPLGLPSPKDLPVGLHGSAEGHCYSSTHYIYNVRLLPGVSHNAVCQVPFIFPLKLLHADCCSRFLCQRETSSRWRDLGSFQILQSNSKLKKPLPRLSKTVSSAAFWALGIRFLFKPHDLQESFSHRKTW